MENIGALAILLAFCLAAYAVIGSVIGKLKKSPFLIVSAERAVYSVWILLTLAAGLLVYFLLTGDFRLAYVASHTDQSMSNIYKFTAWWGGQEGSLLLWAWLLSTYSAVVVFMNRRKFRDMMPWVTSVLMATETFFLILIAFVLSPFAVLMAGRGNIVLLAATGVGLALSRALFEARDAAAAGARQAAPLVARARQRLEQAGAKVDYVEVVDPLALTPVVEAMPGSVMLLAATLGRTRLIDNLVLP